MMPLVSEDTRYTRSDARGHALVDAVKKLIVGCLLRCPAVSESTNE
ncbi:MAG TPA: hypothetical protein VNV88_06950 [Candidatus Solibacter sp.]|jgi:hypothetical protein|nr:hypothetical protein [Candidatus Solibacter sp.]